MRYPLIEINIHMLYLPRCTLRIPFTSLYTHIHPPLHSTCSAPPHTEIKFPGNLFASTASEQGIIHLKWLQWVISRLTFYSPPPVRELPRWTTSEHQVQQHSGGFQGSSTTMIWCSRQLGWWLAQVWNLASYPSKASLCRTCLLPLQSAGAVGECSSQQYPPWHRL